MWFFFRCARLSYVVPYRKINSKFDVDVRKQERQIRVANSVQTIRNTIYMRFFFLNVYIEFWVDFLCDTTTCHSVAYLRYFLLVCDFFNTLFKFNSTPVAQHYLLAA